MAKHLHVNENDDKQLIHIIDPIHKMTVQANMPETMTVGVGSDIGSPFAGYASEGTAAKVLALSTGASSKIGIVTKRLFMGIDQPDISLDLKFEAYYSAFDEVLIPAVKLMLMATSEEKNLEGAIRKILKGLEKAETIGGDALASLNDTKRVDTDKLINYIKTPAVCKIKFGDIFTVRNAFLSNVSVSFSNVLDSDFVPMEATVSITITPQDPFTKNEVVTMFKKQLQGRASRSKDSVNLSGLQGS